MHLSLMNKIPALYTELIYTELPYVSWNKRRRPHHHQQHYRIPCVSFYVVYGRFMYE